jgi:hypothetical protein
MAEQNKGNINPYLETDKEHKKWYELGMMGKQRGKPKAVPPKVKKSKGEFSKPKRGI